MTSGNANSTGKEQLIGVILSVLSHCGIQLGPLLRDAVVEVAQIMSEVDRVSEKPTWDPGTMPRNTLHGHPTAKAETGPSRQNRATNPTSRPAASTVSQTVDESRDKPYSFSNRREEAIEIWSSEEEKDKSVLILHRNDSQAIRPEAVSKAQTVNSDTTRSPSLTLTEVLGPQRKLGSSNSLKNPIALSSDVFPLAEITGQPLKRNTTTQGQKDNMEHLYIHTDAGPSRPRPATPSRETSKTKKSKLTNRGQAGSTPARKRPRQQTQKPIKAIGSSENPIPIDLSPEPDPNALRARLKARYRRPSPSSRPPASRPVTTKHKALPGRPSTPVQSTPLQKPGPNPSRCSTPTLADRTASKTAAAGPPNVNSSKPVSGLADQSRTPARTGSAASLSRRGSPDNRDLLEKLGSPAKKSAGAFGTHAKNNNSGRSIIGRTISREIAIGRADSPHHPASQGSPSASTTQRNAASCASAPSAKPPLFDQVPSAMGQGLRSGLSSAASTPKSRIQRLSDTTDVASSVGFKLANPSAKLDQKTSVAAVNTAALNELSQKTASTSLILSDRHKLPPSPLKHQLSAGTEQDNPGPFVSHEHGPNSPEARPKRARPDAESCAIPSVDQPDWRTVRASASSPTKRKKTTALTGIVSPSGREQPSKLGSPVSSLSRHATYLHSSLLTSLDSNSASVSPSKRPAGHQTVIAASDTEEDEQQEEEVDLVSWASLLCAWLTSSWPNGPISILMPRIRPCYHLASQSQNRGQQQHKTRLL